MVKGIGQRVTNQGAEVLFLPLALSLYCLTLFEVV